MGTKSMCVKLVSHTGSGFRKTRSYIKKTTSKFRRRVNRDRLDDAPVRVTEGWVD